MSSRLKGKVAAIIVAAGSSSRMGTVGDKLSAELGGRPLLIWALETFESAEIVDDVVLVVREVDRWESIVREYRMGKVRQIVQGGKERTDSVWLGLNALSERPEVVLIHDGARPFVTVSLIERVARAAGDFGAVVPVTKITDTIKLVEDEFAIAGTLEREHVVAVQTPQGFRFELLYDSYSRSVAEAFRATDDSAIVEKYGGRVYSVPGEKENMKITDPHDLKVARALVRQNSRTASVGIGYDIHKVAPGSRLVLGGVQISCDFGLIGHSDADVLTHAIMDALLGAAGLGDIGLHFPNDNPSLKGAFSLELLRQVVFRLNQRGFTVSNVDATVIAEGPRLLPYAEEMRQRLASTMGISHEQVNVKFTTNEGIDGVGRGQAIAAYAVAALGQTGKSRA